MLALLTSSTVDGDRWQWHRLHADLGGAHELSIGPFGTCTATDAFRLMRGALRLLGLLFLAQLSKLLSLRPLRTQSIRTGKDGMSRAT